MRQGTSRPPPPPPSGTTSPSGAGPVSGGGAAKLAASDENGASAFALGRTIDSADVSAAPQVAAGHSDTMAALAARQSGSFALDATGIRMEAEPAGLDETSDGSSGGSRDGPRGGPSSVVSVGGDNLLGTVLGERYRLEKRVGEGGMGLVYQAEHLALKTKVAVKVLVRSAGEISRKRFLLEAQMASKVRHPNIVYLADYGVLPDSRPYLVMEFLSGPTLTDVLRGGPLSPLRACRIALQIAKGMQTVHDQGIVHRDLKPSNIFLLAGDATVGQEDFVKIVDFGVAKDTTAQQNPPEPDKDGTSPAPSSTSGGGTAPARDQHTSLGSSLTRADAQIGTPQYMAPEQIDGGIVDARTDQYAFGCILYRMLTGSLPFMADNADAVMRMHVEASVLPPRQKLPSLVISDSLEALVLRCLAKHAEDRFSSMTELAQAIAQEIETLEGRHRSSGTPLSGRSLATRGLASGFFLRYAQPRTWLLLTLGLGLGLGILATLLLRRSPGENGDAASRPSLAEIMGLRQRAVQILTKALAASAPELRRTASQALGRAGEVGARSAISALLADQLPEVRAQAALSLARLGDGSTAAELRRALDGDTVASVRVAAASAMAQLGDEQGSRFLRQALEGSSAGASPAASDLRLRAAFLLCEQGDLRAIELLSGWLDRGILPSAVQGSALGCLSQAAVTSATRQLLTRMQSNATMEERIAAAARLAKAREPQALAFLRQLSKDAGPHQLLAARTLAAPSEPTVGPVLRKILNDRQAALPARVLAAEGLGLLGQLGDLRLLGQTLDSLGNDEAGSDLRHAVAAAVLDVSQSDPAVMSAQSLSWARSALSDNDWVVRSEALLVLGDSNEGADLQRISSLMNDSDVRVRRNAARALGRRRDPGAILALRQALKDTDASVRQEAWGSIGRLAKSLTGEERRSVISEGQRSLNIAVESGNVEEQVIARSTLAALGDSEQRAGIRKLAESSDSQTRAAVAGQAKEDPELLRRLLADREFAVRFAAAQRLAEQGDARAAGVLREGLDRGGSDGLLSYALLRRLGQPATAPSDLGQRLTRGTTEERMQIVRTASQLPAEAAQSTLLQAARDRDLSVRRAVLDVAEAMLSSDNQDAAEAALVLLGSDANRSIRARASMLLLSRPSKPETGNGSGANAVKRSKPSSGTNTNPDAGAATANAPASPPPGDSAGSGPTAAEPDPVASDAATDEKSARKAKAAQALLESGSQAAARSDYKRAIKLLSRAASSCSRGRPGSGSACTRVVYEATFSIGEIYAQQGRLADAAAEYEKAKELQAKGGPSSHRDAISQALTSLKSKLGTVVILREQKGRCRKRVEWVPPGRHMLKVDGETRMVNVVAGQQTEVGQCP